MKRYLALAIFLAGLLALIALNRPWAVPDEGDDPCDSPSTSRPGPSRPCPQASPTPAPQPRPMPCPKPTPAPTINPYDHKFGEPW